MQTEAAKKIIEDTFNQSYDLGRFKAFLRELTKGYEERNTNSVVPDNFKDGIKSVFRVGKFKDSKGDEIDLVAVTLQNDYSLDRARTLQRNYIARYLKGREKDAALVAFIAPESGAWRFSLVRRELGIKLNAKGKTKAFDEISPARRFSFLVGKGEKTHTAKRQLMPLLETDSKPSLASLEKAFNIETVTDEFFEEYRELFGTVKDQIDDHLKGNTEVKEHFEEKDISSADFAKRLLGQIVFLYFLQKKGWLGVPKDKKWGEGSKTFLRDLYEKAKKDNKNFFNEYLEPLFYEALNRDHSDNNHYYKLFDSRIPFLNGGLFDAYHDYDWHSVDIELSNEIFSKHGKSLFAGIDGVGILDVFDRYNFTVAEDEPLEREVAIDPEMLGKVFERLLPAGERGDKGTFYTPREIVHYMCQESLIAYLSANIQDLDKSEVEDFIRYGDLMLEHDARVLSGDKTDTYKDVFLGKTIQDNLKAIDDALARVKVCDPAIGSGAFPVGMMSEIVRARKLLAVHRKVKVSNYDLKRDTIHNSLYGVDLDSGAIEIAKLRLWLSLVVDEDSFDNIQALPNLDYKIMQGNSLLQTYEGIRLFKETLLQSHDNATKVKKKIQSEIDDLNATLRALGAMSAPVPPSQKRAIKDEIGKKEAVIKRLEAAASKEKAPSFFDGDSKAEELAEQLKKLHTDFFRSASPSEKKKLRARIEELEWQLIEASLKEQGKSAKLDEIKKLQKANIRPYFLWRLHFSDVFSGENGGFDIVIANPPYGAISSKDSQDRYKNEYEVFSVRAESYVLFTEQGIKILKNSGIISYITPDTYLNLGFTKKLREYLLSETIIQEIFVLPASVFEEATVDTAILLSKKTAKDQTFHPCDITVKGFDKKLTSFSMEAPTYKIDAKSKDWYESGIFNVLSDDKDLLIINKIEAATHKVEELAEIFSGIKVYEVGKGNPSQSKATLKERPYTSPTKINANFSPFLDGKHISRYETTWAENNFINYGEWLAAPRKPENFLGKKILIRKIVSHRLIATLINDKAYCNTLLFVLKLLPTAKISYECMLAIINSSLIGWFFKKRFQISDEDTFPQIMIRDIYQFPIPSVENKIQEKISKLVQEVLNKKRSSPDADVSSLEREIDQEVYRLYKLDAMEIDIIEFATKNAQKKAA